MERCFEKWKGAWIQVLQSCVKNFDQRCPGRQRECNTILPLLLSNAVGRMHNVCPKIFKKKLKKDWPHVVGFLLEASSGSGGSFFFRCLSECYPCPLTGWEKKEHLLCLRHPYITFSSLLHCTIQLDRFIDLFFHSSKNIFWTRDFSKVSSISFDPSSSFTENIFRIREGLVASLHDDSSLEHALQSLVLAATRLRDLYGVFIQDILMYCEKESLSFFDALVRDKGEKETLWHLMVMGGPLLFVSFKGWNSFEDFSLPSHSLTGEVFPVEFFQNSVITMMQRFFKTIQHAQLPLVVSCHYDSTAHFEKHQQENTRNPCGATISSYQLDKDARQKKLSRRVWLKHFLFVLPFKRLVSLESRRDVVNWFFNQPLIKSRWSLPLDVRNRLVECVSNCSVVEIIQFLKHLSVRTFYNSSHFFETTPHELTDVHLREALKHLASLTSFRDSSHIHVRLKQSLCEPERFPQVYFHWTPTQEAIWHKVEETLIGPFLKTNKKGWSPFTCVVEGDTGSGKTHLALSIADACDIPTLRVFPSDIMKPFLGDSEKRLNEIFQFALRSPPCLILLESAETWCTTTTDAPNDNCTFEQVTSDVTSRLTLELLRQLDQLRLGCQMKKEPSPLLVVLTINSDKGNPDNLSGSPFSLPHRQVLMIKLPSSQSWTPHELAMLFLSQNQKQLTLCDHLKTSPLESLTTLFDESNISSLGPAFITQLSSQLDRQKLKKMIQAETFSMDTPLETSSKELKRCVSQSMCFCDLQLFLKQRQF